MQPASQIKFSTLLSMESLRDKNGVKTELVTEFTAKIVTNLGFKQPSSANAQAS